MRAFAIVAIALLSIAVVSAGSHEDEATHETHAEAHRGDKQAYEADEDEERKLGPSADVEIHYLFPEYPDKKMKLGEQITLLVNFRNRGDNVFNITYVHASLRSAFDYSYMINNFSAWPVDVSVGPSQEASIEYNFKPGDLEPAEFWFSAVVFYNNSNDVYANTIYNGTVELIELRSGSEVRRLFTYVLVFATLGLVAYVVLQLNKTIKTKKPTTVERGTIERADVQVYTPKTKAAPVKRKSKTASKEKSPRVKKASGSAEEADDE